MTRRILVTGAQQGIGADTALAFAETGAHVAINWLDDEPAAEVLAEACRAAGGEGLPIHGNVATAAGCARLVEEAAARLGGIDVLVNNAGILPATPALEITEEEWDRVLAVNLKGAFFCSQAAARAMIAQGASEGEGRAIVNLSSIMVGGTAQIAAHYIASKCAIEGVTRTLSASFAAHGIRVNAIAPGLVDTAQPRGHMSQAQFDAAQAAVPLKRVGTCREIADAILFLAGEGARYITGQTIHVNGGLLLR